MPGYHRYVFDTENRTFVGKFEEMYRAEDAEGFDSWFERDLRHLRKRLSYQILNAYNFERVLEIGCGKGTFTHLLKKRNNSVLGVDSSSTAVRKAQQSFADIDFRCIDAQDVGTLQETFDLVVVMGTFAYIDGWQGVVAEIAKMTRWLYVAEYIPQDPIGFVKSATDLVVEIEKHFLIRTKILLNDDQCLLLAETIGGSP